jgi:hypothetical protein
MTSPPPVIVQIAVTALVSNACLALAVAPTPLDIAILGVNSWALWRVWRAWR